MSADFLERIIQRRLGRVRKQTGTMYNRRNRKLVRRKRDASQKFGYGRKEDMERKDIDGSIKKYIDDSSDVFTLSEEKPEFYLAATCLNDHYITKILNDRATSGLSVFQQSESLVCNSTDWVTFIRKHFEGCQILEFSKQAGMVIDGLNFIDYASDSNSVEVKIYGDDKYVTEKSEFLTSNFVVAPCHVEWVYSSDGASVNIPMLGEKLPVSEMYPFLDGESVEQYYDRFIESSASILLLIGPPGTGKTTFIRGLLHHAGENAMVTYDEKILDRDHIFARFIEEDVSVMVIEDADNFLKSRSDGNSMMHRFLNVGDGLITVKGKKMVFSTNLPSIKDIDPALVRPGRCFDILHFCNYNKEQAKALAERLDIPFREKESASDDYSLAEIFHEQSNRRKAPERKMGFV